MPKIETEKDIEVGKELADGLSDRFFKIFDYDPLENTWLPDYGIDLARVYASFKNLEIIRNISPATLTRGYLDTILDQLVFSEMKILEYEKLKKEGNLF